jgi:hypothetical protein
MRQIHDQLFCHQNWLFNWTVQASRNGHKELVRCLCLAGCRIDVKNKEGVTPDMTALAQGHGDISELLKRLKRV